MSRTPRWRVPFEDVVDPPPRPSQPNDPRDAAPPPRGIARSLALVAALTAWNYASDRWSDRLGIATDSFASPWKVPLIACGTTITLGGVVGLGSLVWGRTSLRGLGWTLHKPRHWVALGLVQTVFLVGVIFGVIAVAGGIDAARDLGDAVASTSIGMRAFFAVMGVRNAVLEESLFRGDRLRSLEPRLGAAGAVIASSVAFAAYHRTLVPFPLLMKFVMGLVFAASASRTRSLVPSAIAHALLWAVLCDN
jgi:membrane protease YdiL (CAAX protease family)